MTQLIVDSFKSELGENPDGKDLPEWYARAQDLAMKLGGKRQPTGLWSCGNSYLFPDGSSCIVVADRAV